MEQDSAPPLTTDTLGLLERYTVDGPDALRDPAVATAVAAHPHVVAELENALDVLRQSLAPTRSTPPPLAARSARPRAITTSRIATMRVAIMGVAASALVMLGMFAAWMNRAPGITPTHTYASSMGQRTTVHLEDGSVVTLAPATTMRATGRMAVVRGEAYFVIAARPNRPFVVQTANAIVRVLGTSFSVRQYATDAASRVVVEDGKIALRAVRQSVLDTASRILSAGMAGRVTDSVIAVTSGVAVRDDLAWTEGRLVFRDTPLGEVATELSRAYGDTIEVADSVLAAQRMTMAASIDQQPLTQILDFACRAIGAHYVRRGKAFIVSPGRHQTQTPQFQRFPRPEKKYGL